MTASPPDTSPSLESQVAALRDVSQRIAAQLERVIFGKASAIDQTLTCLLSGGHLLIEDVPGTAKTLLARALARTIGGAFSRIQFTPDLLPTEVTGSSIFRPDTREFEFHAGPVFTNVLLADEINRATPRTQSALLEAMAERQVSADGQTRALPAPFFVVATQNPVEQEGTFPLPEAQLDRFAMRISIGYPGPDAEEKMLVEDRLDPLQAVEPVLKVEQLAQAQQIVRRVTVAPELRRWIVALAGSTRDDERFVLGAGPRASKALYRAAQAYAGIRGRSFVQPDDIRALVPLVFPHRVVLAPRARLKNESPSDAVREVTQLVRVPQPRPPRNASRVGASSAPGAPPSTPASPTPKTKLTLD